MKFKLFCLHEYGEIIKGYQYCKKCNKAKFIGCNHKYKIIHTHERWEVWENESRGNIYTLQCEICGYVIKRDCSWYRNYEKVLL